MRLTFLLLLGCCLQLSANSYAQQVTFTGRNVSLEKVFTEIERQTGNVVFVSKQLLKDAKPVSVAVKNMPLEGFLTMILKDQSMEYTVEKQTIFIKKKQSAMSPPVAVAPVFMPISGVVLDSLGTPLAGATIRIKGKDISTVSNAAGQFSIQADANDVLLISFVGYRSLEHRVKSNAPLMITLYPESTTMSGIAVTVNTGYQSIPRERATGAFSIVTAKQLENKLRPDLKAALEGQVAGMMLKNDGNLEIRGVSTFNAETAPLVIVDGYPLSGGLETLNIDNIESVTVLKDGVAASIYGARSSNGVIVITTKAGRKGALNVGYNGSFGVTQAPDLSFLRRSSAKDYVEAEVDLFNQDPITPGFYYDNNMYISRVNYLLVAKARGLKSAADVDAEIEQLKKNDGIGQLQDYLFRDQLTQQHNISLSGGSDKNQAAATVKFISNRGNMLYTSDNRLIADVRNDWKPARWLSVRLLTNVNYSTGKSPVRKLNDLLNYYPTSYLHPYDLVVDPATGRYADVFSINPKLAGRFATFSGMKPTNYNPLEDMALETSRTQNLQVRFTGGLNIALARGLTLDAGGSWTRGNAFTRSISSANSFRMRLAYNGGTSVSNPEKHYIPDGDMLNESRNVNQAYTLRAQLNYQREFGVHSIIALAGSEITRDVRDFNAYPTRFGYNDQSGTFATFNYADYNAGLYNADMISTIGKPASTVNIGAMEFRDNRFVSWYANASYEYDRRYLLSGSIRLDQTNFFGTDPRFRYKPLWSAGGTYKISNEQFYDVSWLNKLYVRGSFGINGNISLSAGPFLIIAPDQYSNLTGDISYRISSAPNRSLRWEKTATTNVGVDMSFFKRVNMSVDYYLRRSGSLLATNAVDPTIGYTSLIQNVGSINNNGLEVTLDGNVLKQKEFTWHVLGTIGYNRNKVMRYNANYLYANSLTTYSINKEGYPSNALFSYRAAGIDNNGNALYLNSKNEPISAGALQVQDVVFSGTLRPKMAYSLTNTFIYKNFQLSFMLLAKTGAVMRKYVYDGYGIQHADVGKRWKQPGDEKTAIYPKLASFSNDMFNFPYSNTFVESANYVKLRDASLTYNFDRKLLRKAGMSNASLTLMGRNLLLLAANSDKRDPEAYEMNASDPTNAELGYTPFRPMPELYLGLRVNF
ncbi:SusC/RagA family TonB-linked outer membrane protein [Chitinophaga sedimenti]|uniref:SusC/RagA family TonB-linked outer membrane protein n=1 Tax=Chitinophaga sedimenti TaxID=2033606 RepID=UPI002004F480|nr:SusC/RagA family TonB-linked outer membrane protein [Chitinophaga sedimenti]MCK7557599.1 SusC/RagA family TonB-linked outer membrane protein [Chitinophaga sedimenti]